MNLSNRFSLSILGSLSLATKVVNAAKASAICAFVLAAVMIPGRILTR
ncbi:hypothetical protein A2U01_0103841, partial [Trifolium medium]|nr:hypothetical protein [Trifolium medium]